MMRKLVMCWVRALRRIWRMGDPYRIDRRGNAAIEFAIIAPVLLLMVAIGIDGTMAATAKGELVFATQQAAILTANGGSASAVQSLFASDLAGPAANGASVTCTSSSGSGTCTGSSTYKFAFAGILNSPSLALSYTATAAAQQTAQQ